MLLAAGDGRPGCRLLLTVLVPPVWVKLPVPFEPMNWFPGRQAAAAQGIGAAAAGVETQVETVDHGIGATALREGANAGAPNNLVRRMEAAALEVVGAAAAGVVPQVKGVDRGIGAAGLGEAAAAIPADELVPRDEAAAAQGVGAAAAVPPSGNFSLSFV